MQIHGAHNNRNVNMKYLGLSLTLLLLYSGICTAKDYTLEISRKDRNFVFNSTLRVKAAAGENHINVEGKYNDWRCSAWTHPAGGGLEVACYSQNFRDTFDVHSLIRCNSDDFMYLDGLDMTCR
jgi:hypothetical protein